MAADTPLRFYPMKKLALCLLASALAQITVPMARADVIVQNTGGSGMAPSLYIGESFLTPSQFQYYHVTFNFYSNVPPTTPAAAGTAFLLSQPYAGTPANLSASTPGYLTASSVASSGLYTFDPSFVLLSNTEYYLYTNATLATSGGNTVANAQVYAATGANTNFAPSGTAAANFSLNGMQVPEPSTWAMLGMGVAGAGVATLRRRRVRTLTAGETS